MPTFSAIAFDHLIEPGASKSSERSDPHSVPSHNFLKRPPPHPKHERSNSASAEERRNSASTEERKVARPQMSPALYATPASTPLPDAPSSFPPSPYIINHKRRGPRLLKSSSEINVSSHQGTPKAENVNANAENADTKPSYSTEEVHANGGHDCSVGTGKREDEKSDGKNVCLDKGFGSHDSLNRVAEDNGSQKFVALNSRGGSGEFEDFLDTQELLGYTSNTDGEDNDVHERAAKLGASIGEFFDAPEELFSEGPQASVRDTETELRDIRLALLLEIEKRKQAEETLDEMRSQWQRMRQHLAPLGLTLGAKLTVEEGTDPAAELCQQVYIARFVSESIGRAIAKAEVEEEMEAQVEAKNFEIARLLDRLHYYEAVNREMSQRNQEAVGLARRQRQGRKRKQMWVWGSIGAVVTIGSAAALVWSYLPARSSSSEAPHATK